MTTPNFVTRFFETRRAADRQAKYLSEHGVPAIVQKRIDKARQVFFYEVVPYRVERDDD